MPNWCNNYVTFSGEEKNIENLKKLIDKTIEQEKKTYRGQLLFGLEGELDGYMFNLNNNANASITFESRWSPIPQEMVRIAQIFDLTFEYEYEESGNNLYGCYTYDSEGYLYDQYLQDEEINACRIKDEDDDPDDPDEISGIDNDAIWDMVANADRHGVEIHSSLKQPEE
jgi:hypothetical protein